MLGSIIADKCGCVFQLRISEMNQYEECDQGALTTAVVGVIFVAGLVPSASASDNTPSPTPAPGSTSSPRFFKGPGPGKCRSIIIEYSLKDSPTNTWHETITFCGNRTHPHPRSTRTNWRITRNYVFKYDDGPPSGSDEQIHGTD